MAMDEIHLLVAIATDSTYGEQNYKIARPGGCRWLSGVGIGGRRRRWWHGMVACSSRLIRIYEEKTRHALDRSPEEQGKVQAELDEAIGRHRGSSISHCSYRQLLPTNTFLLVCMPSSPRLRDRDLFLPMAGTTVYGNTWAICRDPEVYPEPDAFKHQRWIDDQGHLRDDLNNFLFGFGRRSSLDPTQPLDDMGFMNSEKTHRPCPIEFELRIPEAELRRMMKSYPEVVSWTTLISTRKRTNNLFGMIRLHPNHAQELCSQRLIL
ncbi:cytochrome P450 [Suillus occidentalis]|nr:cytochrome P450 [Suillus occidentalis]